MANDDDTSLALASVCKCACVCVCVFVYGVCYRLPFLCTHTTSVGLRRLAAVGRRLLASALAAKASPPPRLASPAQTSVWPCSPGFDFTRRRDKRKEERREKKRKRAAEDIGARGASLNAAICQSSFKLLTARLEREGGGRGERRECGGRGEREGTAGREGEGKGGE